MIGGVGRSKVRSSIATSCAAVVAVAQTLMRRDLKFIFPNILKNMKHQCQQRHKQLENVNFGLFRNQICILKITYLNHFYLVEILSP